MVRTSARRREESRERWRRWNERERQESLTRGQPDPDEIGKAVWLFELYASRAYSDDTLALEAARRGFTSRRTGRPLTAAGIADLLRNPVYNGYLVRFRGLADEERLAAPWRYRTVERPDRSSGAGVGSGLHDRV